MKHDNSFADQGAEKYSGNAFGTFGAQTSLTANSRR